jgi:hypothetical protein
MKQRCAQRLKNRHMIIENVSIGKKCVRPSPHHMQRLRLVGIYSEVVSKQDAEDQRDAEEKDRKQPIGLGQFSVAAMIRMTQLSVPRCGAPRRSRPTNQIE